MLNVMVATLNMLEVTVNCDRNFECRSLNELLRVYLYTIEMERLNQNSSQSSFKAARCYSPKILPAVTNINDVSALACSRGPSRRLYNSSPGSWGCEVARIQ